MANMKQRTKFRANRSRIGYAAGRKDQMVFVRANHQENTVVGFLVIVDRLNKVAAAIRHQ